MNRRRFRHVFCICFYNYSLSAVNSSFYTHYRITECFSSNKGKLCLRRIFSLDKCPAMGQLDHKVVLKFFENLHADFHSGYTSLCSYQHYLRVPFPPQPYQHIYFSFIVKVIVNEDFCNWNDILFPLKKKKSIVFTKLKCETEMRPVEAEQRSKIGWAPFSWFCPLLFLVLLFLPIFPCHPW